MRDPPPPRRRDTQFSSAQQQYEQSQAWIAQQDQVAQEYEGARAQWEEQHTRDVKEYREKHHQRRTQALQKEEERRKRHEAERLEAERQKRDRAFALARLEGREGDPLSPDYVGFVDDMQRRTEELQQEDNRSVVYGEDGWYGAMKAKSNAGEPERRRSIHAEELERRRSMTIWPGRRDSEPIRRPSPTEEMREKKKKKKQKQREPDRESDSHHHLFHRHGELKVMNPDEEETRLDIHRIKKKFRKGMRKFFQGWI